VDTEYYLPWGSTHDGPLSLVVTPTLPRWRYCGLRVVQLGPGETYAFDTGEDEVVVLPLNGGCTVSCDGERIDLVGRENVFSRVSDFVYVPRDAQVEVSSRAGGRFALPFARAGRRLPVAYGAAENVPVELRGAGQASRQVNNFCAPGSFEADKLIAVEVLTPGGNWSSYPPHKHDQNRPGEEEALEEIYYFEIAESHGTPGFGYQRVYTSGSDRQIDVCAEVRSGDVVLIPYGYHGPSMAAPGYDMYYLNVMAGPGEERVWRFCDDPAHAWIRATWPAQRIDPRLPLTSHRRRA
jgi:5-deoxy-glucuronate isomerase